MNRKSNSLPHQTLLSVLFSSLLFQPAAHTATLLANSWEDWASATQNGLGLVGADDSPEQGHTDTASAGFWYYRAGDSSIDLDLGNGSDMDWREGSAGYQYLGNFGITQFNMGPPHAEGSGDLAFAQRIWESGHDGLVRIMGNFTNQSGIGTGVFVTVHVMRSGNPDIMAVNQFFAPNGSESLDFDFDVEVQSGDLVGFVVGPNGDNTNDNVRFGASIFSIPEPAISILALLGCGIPLFRRRRD
ncbi:MAG: hypothetical protein AAGJ79_05455 [Verrucomicrobiota bacterium]